MFIYFGFAFILSFMMLSLFFFLSKSEIWDLNFASGFECGFTSYFFSRFSFSVHYFLISLVFLFLDLELSFIFVFFLSYVSTFVLIFNLLFFIMILLLGLFMEWFELKLEWVY